MSHYGLMEVPANGPTSPRRRFVQVYSDFLRDRSLSSDARFLGTLFASFVGREGLAFPGTRQLMLLTGWGRHRITRARSELTRNERMTKVEL